ncbi:MAG: glycosyltransferase [Gemmatimonadota bacterium]
MSGLGIALALQSDGPGGAERVLLELGEELRRRGHEVCPIGPSDGCGWLAEQFRSRGFVPETFTLRRALDPGCRRGLVEVLRRRGIDVMHSHEFAMALYGASAARAVGIPHVITLHGSTYYADRLRRRIALRWAFRRSAAAVAVSGATGERIRTSLGLPADAIEVIRNGIRPAPGDRMETRAALGLGEDEVLAIAVGNLYPVKGYDVLLRALAMAAGTVSAPWRLAVVGRGEEEAALRDLAGRLGLAPRVRWLGYRDDVPDLMAAADVYVMSSRSEGLPLAVLEAMFAGLPIVATRVGGIPEAVGADREGLLVEPQDPGDLAAALSRLLGDPALRDRLAAAARRRAERDYHVEVMTDAYERLYRKGRS